MITPSIRSLDIMEKPCLEEPLSPNPHEISPLKPSCMVIWLRTALYVLLGCRAASGSPVCDQPLQVWIYFFLTFILVICLLDTFHLTGIGDKEVISDVRIGAYAGVTVWVGYGVWVLWSSEKCDEELWIYSASVVWPLCLLGTVPSIVLVVDDCWNGTAFWVAAVRRLREAFVEESKSYTSNTYRPVV